MSTIRKFLFDRTQEPVTLAKAVALPHCANCSQELHGVFCSHCGQKKESHHDLTIIHFFGHAFHEFTHVDSRIFRSFKYILTRPGYLTEQFIAGHRKKFINPIRLFILVNIFYFLFVFLTGNNTFSTQLKYQIGSPAQARQKEMVEQKVRESGITYESYAEQFDHATRGKAKSLVIIMVPMFALIAGLLFYNRKRYAIEYLCFSLEVYSMILMLLSIGIGALVVASQIGILLVDKLLILLSVIDKGQAKQHIMSVNNFLNDDFSMSALIILTGSVLLFASIKRVFRQSNFTTLIKTAVATFAICNIVGLYRIILFYVTFYSLHVSH